MHGARLDGKNETDVLVYSILIMSLILSHRETPRHEWDDVIAVTRKLKSLGDPQKETLNGSPVYILKPEGGTLALERSELAVLRTFVEQPIWRPTALEEVKQTLDWLTALPEMRPQLEPV